MKMFSRQFPIKRTDSRAHTTIIEGPNLFCQKSSFHSPQKNASFNVGLFQQVFNDLKLNNLAKEARRLKLEDRL